MQKINTNSYNTTLFLVLLLMQCFGFVLLSSHALLYPILTAILFYFWFLHYKMRKGYGGIISSYVLFVGISCIVSFVYYGQNPAKVLLRSYPFMGMLSFFVFAHYNISSKDATRMLRILCFLFVSCYIVQWLIYPTVIVFSGARWNISDDHFRMRMTGSILSYLLFFMSINRFITTNKKKELLYACMGIIPILLMGFRSLFALSLILICIMSFFVNRRITAVLKYVLVGTVLVFVESQTPLVKDKINEMNERTETNQTFANSDYIRWMEYDYYNSVFKDPVVRCLGAGMYVIDGNKYAKMMDNATVYYAFYWEDLGLVGLSFIIGIPAVLLLVFMVLKCVWKCKYKDLQYIRFSLLAVFLGSVFTSMELYRGGNLIIVGLLFYIVYQKEIECQ